MATASAVRIDHGGEVQEEAKRTRHPGEPRHERHLAAHGPLESRPALVDEVVTDVGRPVVDCPPGAPRRLSQIEYRRLRHFHLAVRAAAGDGLDGVPVAVAGEEVLVGVDTGRVESQHVFDQAQVLDELSPVKGRDEAETADAVGYGDLVGRPRCDWRLPTAGPRSDPGRKADAPARPERTRVPGPGPGAGRRSPRRTGPSAARRRSANSASTWNKALGLFPGRGEDAVRPGDRHVALLAAARDPRAPRAGCSRAVPAAA